MKTNDDKLREFCQNKISSDAKFMIPAISKEKVLKFLSSIDINMATDTDMVGPCLLKFAAPFITDEITFICNHSINSSVFLSKWKEAKVAPLQKMALMRKLIIIAQFQFCLFCLKYLKSMFMKVCQVFYINMNYYTKPSLVFELSIHVKLLL